MGDPVNTANIRHEDVIDCIELAINLWQEKWPIIAAVIITARIGVTMAINHEKGLTTSYKAYFQLNIPSSTEHECFNQT